MSEVLEVRHLGGVVRLDLVAQLAWVLRLVQSDCFEGVALDALGLD
jgi:hypothetical protein